MKYFTPVRLRWMDINNFVFLKDLVVVRTHFYWKGAFSVGSVVSPNPV